MLGVGDFYYELGVQIIEVCLALKHRNGGEFKLDLKALLSLRTCLIYILLKAISNMFSFFFFTETWTKCTFYVTFLNCLLIGLITLDELHQRVLKGRGKFAQDVSQWVHLLRFPSTTACPSDWWFHFSKASDLTRQLISWCVRARKCQTLLGYNNPRVESATRVYSRYRVCQSTKCANKLLVSF